MEGYRSIKKVDITLNEGLNIIIGRNGSGKTNFFNFFDAALNLKFDNYLDFNAKLTISNGDDAVISIRRKRTSVNKKSEFKNATITPNDIEYSLSLKNVDSHNKTLMKEGDFLTHPSISFQSNIIKHGIPNDLLIIEKSYSFTIDKNGNPNMNFSFITDSSNSFFLRTMLAELSFAFYNDTEDQISDLKFIKDKILNIFNLALENVKSDLAKYTPIKDIKLNEGISFYFDNSKNLAIVNNILFEFNIDDNWIPFSSLSDGTKRIFLIVTDLACEVKYFFRKTSFGSSSSFPSRIVLIEEPELGIHPHQLHLLMNFLKEQSRDKQIIITTHSPLAIDSISSDEFKRVIICELTSNKGTSLVHMTKKEMNEAAEFISEGMYFSDYWRFTNFNRI